MASSPDLLRLGSAGAAKPAITAGAFPASRKGWVEGKIHPLLRLPRREIAMNPTPAGMGPDAKLLPNAPQRVYEASGPYTDPAVTVDLTKGAAALRREWILARGD